jgi:6-pyruvoyl-tetrahydropterin synthase
LGGIEYGDLKKQFRTYLDETYDHRLLLNASDPFARPIFQIHDAEQDDYRGFYVVPDHKQIFLPGLQSMPGDPTTENIAKWIGEEMLQQLDGYGLEMLHVTVWETGVNMATYAQGFTS